MLFFTWMPVVCLSPQLAKDLAELQLGVGASLAPLEQLGQPTRAVKAFRALLFQPVSAVHAGLGLPGGSSPAAGGGGEGEDGAGEGGSGGAGGGLLAELPPSVIAHHALSR